ncbi:hypothetical protein RND81_13G131000 [Saponaria officinalis]|uniref:Inactive poly [ADP-ribose] polymerase SRO5 n=1 Tax=Saponaria officinalis TaxID=3572 RepID=A0AAW1H078_SAPOF
MDSNFLVFQSENHVYDHNFVAGDSSPATEVAYDGEASVSDCESGITDSSSGHRRRRIFSESMAVEIPENDRSHELIRRKFLAGVEDTAVFTAVHRRNWSENSSTLARIQTFQIHAKAMEKKCGGNPNMKFGWYGGDKDRINQILAHGFSFNDLLINNNGAIFLSPDGFPSQSVDDCGADEDGLRHVLLCRVLLGQSELVQLGSGQVHPSSDEFDSGVDSYENPKNYVIWSANMNTHILPEYVVTFKVKETHSSSQVVSKMRRMPTSPWISFPSLISILAKYLAKDATALITKYHNDYKERKLSRAELIRKVRHIAGDKLLISVIKLFKVNRELKMSSFGLSQYKNINN